MIYKHALDFRDMEGLGYPKKKAALHVAVSELTPIHLTSSLDLE